MAIGCQVKDVDCGIEHTNIKFTNMYQDSFYLGLSQLHGLKPIDNSDSDSDSERNNIVRQTMESIVYGMIDLLNRKMPICDAMLILCVEFLNNYDYNSEENSNEEKKNDDNSGNKLLDIFVDSLNMAVSQCLNENFVNQNTKLRDYFWFKKYLLNSNIWLCNINVKYNNDKCDQLLYSVIDSTINKALYQQKEFIWSNVQKEEINEKSKSNWNKLLHYQNWQTKKYCELRQDLVSNGIKSTQSLNEIYCILARLDDNSNFNVLSQMNGIYLIRSLTFAHSINRQFQNEMRDVFDKISNKLCYFGNAPVKTYSRSLIKSETDYCDRKFPQSSCIIDYLRCSVTFNNVNELFNGLIKFIDFVKNGKCGCVIQIVRIKNGFTNILNWDNVNSCEYCDIKLNVIIFDKETNQSMIGEIQLLLKWLLKAKKIGYVYLLV